MKKTVTTTDQEVGTFLYMAPECFDSQPISSTLGTRADVYSFGILMLELFGIRPYGDVAIVHNVALFADSLRSQRLQPQGFFFFFFFFFFFLFFFFLFIPILLYSPLLTSISTFLLPDLTDWGANRFQTCHPLQQTNCKYIQ